VSYYQLMLIISPALAEEDEKQQFNQIEELLKHEKATIHLVDHWGKRKLASTVKKQRQGYYEWLYFELDPSRVAEIDRKLKMSEQVLRFLMFRMEKPQIASLQKEMARRQEAAQPPPQPVAETAVDDAEELIADDAAAPESTETITEGIAEPAEE
jgi:small subunit ribosomal protein S6